MMVETQCRVEYPPTCLLPQSREFRILRKCRGRAGVTYTVRRTLTGNSRTGDSMEGANRCNSKQSHPVPPHEMAGRGLRRVRPRRGGFAISRLAPRGDPAFRAPLTLQL